jgi:hypothetical protein
VGTASCSARACHGSPTAQASDAEACVNRNEYTRWVATDKHAEAYRVLFSERARGITAKLRSTLPAHEDPSCLACHTNPLATSPEPAAVAERQSGVGCEACHGSAGSWLDAHTQPGWRQRISAEKAALGMIVLADPLQKTKACVGCHVGAAPDQPAGAPARNMNHDMIAAGHPRLNFELTAFLANLPPHWKNIDAPSAAEACRQWALGQVASAEAAVSLLGYRAGLEDGPWLELAEYDCFACHHDLREPSARQRRELEVRGPRSRRLGTARWGSWYLAMPRVLARSELLTANSRLYVALDELASEMEQRAPQSKRCVDSARELATQLGAWASRLQQVKDPTTSLRRFFGSAAEGSMQLGNWDGLEQFYLLANVLCQAGLPNRASADRGEQALQRLGRLLAFPTGRSSPPECPAGAPLEADVRDLIRQLQQ